MNFDELLKNMIGAASTAAKNKWSKLKTFAETQFKVIAAATLQLERETAEELAAAALLPTKKKRDAALAIAKERAALSFDNLALAIDSVVTVAKADVKLAAQDATNAALNVVRTALNAAIRVPIF